MEQQLHDPLIGYAGSLTPTFAAQYDSWIKHEVGENPSLLEEVAEAEGEALIEYIGGQYRYTLPCGTQYTFSAEQKALFDEVNDYLNAYYDAIDAEKVAKAEEDSNVIYINAESIDKLFCHGKAAEVEKKPSTPKEVAEDEEKQSLVEEVAEKEEEPFYIDEVAEKEEEPSLFEEVPKEEEAPKETTQIAIVEKLEDPRKLNFSVEVKGKVFSICLYDIGSSMSLMSHFAIKSLCITTYEPTNISMNFEDHSRKRLLDKIPAHADFSIVELEGEPKDSILLERSFLSIAGAKIDAQRKEVDLHQAHPKTNAERIKVPFDPGGGKLRYFLEYLLRSMAEKDKFLIESLFKESEMFAGTPRIGPDILNIVYSFVTKSYPIVKRRRVQEDSCTGLGAVTRPPDAY